MATGTVAHTLKDHHGVITYLCGPDESWSPRPPPSCRGHRVGAHRYVVAWPERNTDVHVVDGPRGKYLRTDRDTTRRNNLDELPEAPRAVSIRMSSRKSQVTDHRVGQHERERRRGPGGEGQGPPVVPGQAVADGEFEAENGGRPRRRT